MPVASRNSRFDNHPSLDVAEFCNIVSPVGNLMVRKEWKAPRVIVATLTSDGTGKTFPLVSAESHHTLSTYIGS